MISFFLFFFLERIYIVSLYVASKILKYERNVKITGKKHVARYPKSMKVEIDKSLVIF